MSIRPKQETNIMRQQTDYADDYPRPMSREQQSQIIHGVLESTLDDKLKTAALTIVKLSTYEPFSNSRWSPETDSDDNPEFFSVGCWYPNATEMAFVMGINKATAGKRIRGLVDAGFLRPARCTMGFCWLVPTPSRLERREGWESMNWRELRSRKRDDDAGLSVWRDVVEGLGG